MKIDKSKVIIGFLGFVVLGLVLLLVRESEGRVVAETKLNDLKYKMEATASENENISLDLKNIIHDLQMKIADLNAKYEANMAQRTAQIQELGSQMDAEREASDKKYQGMLSQKDNEISETEARSKADNEKLNRLIQDKGAKISELGDELEKASARYSAVLREKESLEAKTISDEADVSSLKNDLKKVQREKERLSQIILAQAKKSEQPHD